MEYWSKTRTCNYHHQIVVWFIVKGGKERLGGINEPRKMTVLMWDSRVAGDGALSDFREILRKKKYVLVLCFYYSVQPLCSSRNVSSTELLFFTIAKICCEFFLLVFRSPLLYHRKCSLKLSVFCYHFLVLSCINYPCLSTFLYQCFIVISCYSPSSVSPFRVNVEILSFLATFIAVLLCCRFFHCFLLLFTVSRVFCSYLRLFLFYFLGRQI